MKTNHMIIVAAIGLIGTGTALAEDTMWSDLSRISQSTSATQPVAVAAGPKQKSYSNMYDQLSAMQSEFALQPKRGVAGRSGDDIDPNGGVRGNWASEHPNASIYEQLSRPSN